MLNIVGTQVAYANGLSDEQLIAVLAYDPHRYEDALNGAIAIDLAQNQFDAPASFCFNIGIDPLLDQHVAQGCQQLQFRRRFR